MTNYESALSELGERLAGTDPSLSTSIAEILAAAIQELVESELTAQIGAAHGERTPSRLAQRNGHRPKLVSTPAGDIEIGIPKLRQGSFFPELGTPTPDRQGPVGGDHDRLRHRHFHEEGRRSRQGSGL
jgi:putative transposase